MNNWSDWQISLVNMLQCCQLCNVSYSTHTSCHLSFTMHSRDVSLHIRLCPAFMPKCCVSEGMCLRWCCPPKPACTPVSSLHGPRRVDIRVKPFEAGLIASCMTVCGSVATHWLYYVSHIVSDIRGSLCLSVLRYDAVLASWSSECKETSQDTFVLWLKDFSHSIYFIWCHVMLNTIWLFIYF